MVLSGCSSPQPIVDLSPLSSQIGKLSSINANLSASNERLQTANDGLSKENLRLLSQLRADADAGLSANAKGWTPFEEYVWRHQVTLLPDVTPDKFTTEKWKEASKLYEAGGEQAMQVVIKDLNDDAAKTNKTIGELKKSVEQLTFERDTAQNKAQLALKDVQKTNENLSSSVEQARQNENKRIMDEVRQSQIAFWNRCGSLLGIAALGLAAGAYFSPISRKKLFEGSMISVVLSTLAFATARFYSSPWFGWSVAGFLSVVGGAYLFYKLKSAHAASQCATKVAKYEKFGAAVVPVLDDAYDNATDAEKVILDSKIFNALSKLEDVEVKAFVNEIRSSIKLENKLNK